jgi:type II secretion system (T2SS) protein M
MKAMRRPTRREWVFGGALAVVVAANVIAYAAIIRPLAVAQSSHHQRVLALQGQIRALQAQGRNLEAQVRTLEEAEAYHQEFPERGQLAPVGVELARLAQGLGVSMPGITYQPEPQKGSDLVRVHLTLSVDGPYGQVRRFLHELEKRRHYLVVERMGLAEHAGAATRGNQVAMQLSLAGYFR